jgi:hypothetical protein
VSNAKAVGIDVPGSCTTDRFRSNGGGEELEAGEGDGDDAAAAAAGGELMLAE